LTLKVNSAEGIADGTAAVTGTQGTTGDGWQLVSILSGTTFQGEVTGAIHGSVSWSCTSSTAANAVQVGWTDTAATEAAVRWYEVWNTFPSATQQNGFNWRGNAGATSLARREVLTDGTWRAVMGSTTDATPAAALSLGTLYRFEAVATGFNGASGALTINCYLGESLSVLTTSAVTGATTALTCDTVRFGKFNGAGTHDVLIDSMASDIGASAELGPLPLPRPRSMSFPSGAAIHSSVW
jgi:hypothetical protein